MGRLKIVKDAGATLMFAAGLAAFSIGVGLVYVPAGVMVAGISAAASAFLYVRGSRGNR